MKLDINRQFGRKRRALAKLALRAMVARGYHPYQPVLVEGRRMAGGVRDSDARLDAVLAIFADTGVETVLDIGSAEGYFVRRCAEAGMTAFGVEADLRRLMVAQWSTALDGVDNIGFIRMRLTPESARLLPGVDATVCLSVLHHVIYEHGLDYGKQLLSALRAKTGKVMIFEMGQSTETTSPWASRLPDMGDDPHTWIAELLRDVGFVGVRKLSEAPGFNSPVGRAVFAAYPPP